MAEKPEQDRPANSNTRWWQSKGSSSYPPPPSRTDGGQQSCCARTLAAKRRRLHPLDDRPHKRAEAPATFQGKAQASNHTLIRSRAQSAPDPRAGNIIPEEAGTMINRRAPLRTQEPGPKQRGKMKQELKLHFAGQVLAKKNRHTIIRIAGRPVVRPDNEAKANEDEMVLQFRTQLLQTERRGFIAKTKEQRILQAKKNRETYTVEIKIWQPNRIRRDLDNQASTIMDALTRAGAIADDCWQFVKKLTIEAGGVSPTPGADINITIATE